MPADVASAASRHQDVGHEAASALDQLRHDVDGGRGVGAEGLRLCDESFGAGQAHGFDFRASRPAGLLDIGRFPVGFSLPRARPVLLDR